MAEQFAYAGVPYTTMGSGTGDKPVGNVDWLTSALYKACPPVFAVDYFRMRLFSEARFQWRRFENGRPQELFGDRSLSVLEQPWVNGTTGDLLARMHQHATLMGNAYVARRLVGGRPRLRVLRPDWVSVVAGTNTDAERPEDAIDLEILGYVYQEGGNGKEVYLPADEVAHWAPVPDPASAWLGMSWLTPILEDAQSDKSATQHKARFFRNAATPNMVVTFDATKTREQVEKFQELFNASHQGSGNAYKTLFLGAGADVRVVGNTFEQMSFSSITGRGETRIAAAAGVPPVLAGLSEGLQASTYSNYAQARRAFADGTLRPLWRNAAGALQSILVAPDGAQLWYDDRDIKFLQEDEQDAASITQTHANTIRALIDAGYDADAVVAAVNTGDLGNLVGAHSGLFSVQLQPAGSTDNEPDADDADTEPDPAPEPDDEPRRFRIIRDADGFVQELEVN